jgi:hypothetical protein
MTINIVVYLKSLTFAKPIFTKTLPVKLSDDHVEITLHYYEVNVVHYLVTTLNFEVGG